MRWRGLDGLAAPTRRSLGWRALRDLPLIPKHAPEPTSFLEVPRPGVSSGWCSLLCGDSISSAESPCAQGGSRNYFEGISITNTLSTVLPALSPDNGPSSTVRPHVHPQGVAPHRAPPLLELLPSGLSHPQLILNTQTHWPDCCRPRRAVAGQAAVRRLRSRAARRSRGMPLVSALRIGAGAGRVSAARLGSATWDRHDCPPNLAV